MSDTQKYDIYSQDFRKRTHEIFANMRQADPIIKQAGLDGENSNLVRLQLRDG